MLKREFEELTGVTVTEEQYETIEFVYMNHPAIDHKTQIAEIYTAGGMQVIIDMVNTAARANQLQQTLKDIKKKEKIILSELNSLRTGRTTNDM